MDGRRLKSAPSEASVKFFDETFLQKSFDLALDLMGVSQEKKLGKQRSAFPGRRRSEKAASPGLGCELVAALSVDKCRGT